MYITLRDRISVTTQSQTTSSEFSIKKNRLPLPKNFGLRMLKNDPFAATVPEWIDENGFIKVNENLHVITGDSLNKEFDFFKNNI